MAREVLITQALVLPGQGLPTPVPPPGEGWELIGQAPAKDEHGKPVMKWTWLREEAEDQEWLTQA